MTWALLFSLNDLVALSVTAMIMTHIQRWWSPLSARATEVLATTSLNPFSRCFMIHSSTCVRRVSLRLLLLVSGTGNGNQLPKKPAHPSWKRSWRSSARSNRQTA